MEERVKGWWDTKIIDLQQNKITISGYRSQDLMGRVSYGEMLYLMTMGRLPDAIAGKLIEAVLVAVCDQGVVSQRLQPAAWRPLAALRLTALSLRE